MIPHSVFGLIVKVDKKMLGGEGALVSIISDCIKDERSFRICILSNSQQGTNPPSCRKTSVPVFLLKTLTITGKTNKK